MQKQTMQKQSVEGYSSAPQQKHLWRLQQVDEENQIWRANCIVSIKGQLDVDTLTRALKSVIRRHEILRTVFHSLPGSTIPVQVIQKNQSPVLKTYRLHGLAPAKRQAKLDDLLDDLSLVPLDPERGPTTRFALITFSESEHTLLVSQHALCADAISSANFVREIARAYGKQKGKKATGEDPPQYADLAEWLNDMFDSEDADEGLARWRAVDFPAIADIRLPYEYLRSEAPTFRPKRFVMPLSSDCRASVERLAAVQEVSPSTIYLGTWVVLLSRLTDRNDLVLGVASPGRSYEVLENALGLLQKFLPVACDAASEISFAALLQRIQKTVEEAVEWHEFFDLDRLGNGDEPPFLPLAFEYHEPVVDAVAGNVLFSVEQRECCSDRYKLKLSCDASGDTLFTRFDYDARLLGHADVGCIAAQYHTLLLNACKNPEKQVGRLEMMSGAERRMLLEGFARVSGAPPAEEYVHRLIEEQARRTPDAVAVEVEGLKLTYGELDRRANQLARHLRDLGVQPDVIVGIYMDRSVELILGILATLKAGGAYLPLPPGYPRERLAFMLEDTGAPVLLTRSAVVGDLPRHGAQTVSLDTDWAAISKHGHEPVNDLVSPDNLAYVIYTSGSTGNPKGVLVTHRNLAHSTSVRLSWYDQPVTRFLLLSSFAFDSSVAGIFWTLCQGGRLVMPREGFEQELTELADMIARSRVSHMLALPSLHALILDHAVPAQLQSLTTVTVAGEVCPEELIDKHVAKLPGVGFFNEYGPTEATVWSTVFNCDTDHRRLPIPIGRPIPGAAVYILDTQLQPTPIGMVGELYIGGAGVAKGYLNRPDLTAERFIPHPFNSTDGERLYKTGDLARYLPDGNIQFLGRVDNQVKIRGYRIELEEIEAVLGRHSTVHEATVVARENAPGDMRLVAYAILRKNAAAPSASVLRDFLAERLPDHMVPAAFVYLDKMPRLPNGKVDRKALPAPDASRPTLGSEYVAPRTPVEEVLAGIWADVLGAEMVGIHDNFFELGGHSILVIRLVSWIRESLKINLPMVAVFDRLNVADLAETILADPAERVRIERTAELLLHVSSLSEEEAKAALKDIMHKGDERTER